MIDNSDGAAGSEFSEISVSRRLDRNGDGGYRLNGARCRLADVTEALSDASLGREMHSVIGQGKVEEIVLSKPRERRLLIEEAAGLGKHRKRRRRAQLKLERTRSNLDRALDVEREARSRLRPLRQQANAAETHARLERQSLELQLRLLGDRLSAGGGDLAAAEAAARAARAERDAIEAKLAEANERRSAVEERLAERDRERTAVWGELTALRAAHERLGARTESIAGREAELRAAVERRRATLGALAAELRATERDAEAALARELEAARAALAEAGEAIAAAIDAADVEARLEALARVRNGSERAARSARRAEDMLGHRRQDSLAGGSRPRPSSPRSSPASAPPSPPPATPSAPGRAPSRSAWSAPRPATSSRPSCASARGSRPSSTASSGSSASASPRPRSAPPASATAARRPRRSGSGSSPGSSSTRPPSRSRSTTRSGPRSRRSIERLIRRREQLGPVNPLAEGEYEEAKEHVAELEAQREDLEQALDELAKLIRQTDREITAAFEETFEAAGENFSELIEHMFPGGSGRLRMVEAQKPERVLGGADPETVAGDGTDAADPDAAAEDEIEEEEQDPAETAGVEIEVTPAGKATRRLSLLSGGEKSLVALAFVFSVFLARPSPFYILDEVEAALDDANIDRFLQLVRRFSDRAQFVIVTHQKRTMDAADVLYGVSMKDGATKVISRRLPREPRLTEAEPDARAA